MNMKCSACSRSVSIDRYCVYHAEAFENLKDHYDKWVKAYGTMSLCDYLNKLVKMNETGIWIKEVIFAELKNYKKGKLKSTLHFSHSAHSTRRHSAHSTTRRSSC